MHTDYRAINTLVLVDNAQQADSIATVLRQTGIPVQQNWVTSNSDFSIALQRDTFDLGIIYCQEGSSDLPSSISRYPDTPFLAILERYKNRAAETLLEHGVTDVAGKSHPIRMRRVIQRLLAEAALRHENEHLRQQQKQQDTLIHSMLQHSAIAVAYLHQGAHGYANAHYQQLTGLNHLEEVQQTPLMDLIASSDRKDVASMLREIETGTRAQANLQVQLQRPDGQRISDELELVPSYFDGESVVQLSARVPRTDIDSVHPADPTPAIDHSLAVTAQTPTNPATEAADKFDATLAIVPVSNELPLQIEMLPMNNLRQDVRERLLVCIDDETAPDRLPGIDYGAFDLTLSLEEQIQQEREQDLWLIDQSLDWLQQHLLTSPDAQLFIPLTAPVTEHGQLATWLIKQLKQRGIAASALALILRYDNERLTAWQRLVNALAATGVNICAAGMSTLSETEASIENGVVRFAFLNHADQDLALAATLSGHIERCRAAQVKTVTRVLRQTDIASVWKSGLDCYVDHSPGSTNLLLNV